MRSFLFYEIMDWKRLVLCFIILLFRFRSCEVRLSHFSLFVISFFTFILSRYVYVSALLAFHLSLMKLYGSRSSNNEAITFEKNLIRFIYSSNALAKKNLKRYIYRAKKLNAKKP